MIIRFVDLLWSFDWFCLLSRFGLGCWAFGLLIGLGFDGFVFWVCLIWLGSIVVTLRLGLEICGYD